ncbi:SecDF P1 head subdomain-containing protein [Thermomonospora umbrina]|uniref:SecDF P1 head subdomain domain-containing protein n=1 Tax=Thermomonospora umbrina TaxID=111806 RepID=A0A3D9SQK0_9ACTN|nr:hypothetical protein [Thermomonospora umbrina]REE98058.1 hypothetical protein DFJ69_3538 [Thermomonospora umbrina]
MVAGPPQSPPPPPSPYVSGPARRGSRTPLIIAIGAGALVLAVAVVFGAFLLVQDDEEPANARRLTASLGFQRVVSSTPGACASGGTPSSDGKTCHRLGPGMTVHELAEIRAVPPDTRGPTWTILITLRPSDATTFGELTRQVSAAPPGTPARQLAIVVGGKVVSAPEVLQPLTSGDVEISGQFTQDGATSLIAQITGTG